MKETHSPENAQNDPNTDKKQPKSTEKPCVCPNTNREDWGVLLCGDPPVHTRMAASHSKKHEGIEVRAASRRPTSANGR